MFERFRRSLRGHASTDADDSPGHPLVGRLREIAAGAPAPEEALEHALEAIVEATHAGAGALCLYDPRQSILRLATEIGFSDDGCRRLRNVRRGDPSTWDIPLHGVLNRRAYLIESPARNRYVPHLVEHFESVRTIACVPVYGGPTPLATIVLLAMAPRSFSEQEIWALERPLREVAKMIEATRRLVAPTLEVFGPGADVPSIVSERDELRATVSARTAEHAVLSAELAARNEERDRLREELHAATEERTRLQSELEAVQRTGERAEVLAESLAAAERERVRLAALLAEQARVHTALEHARAEAERVATAATADLETARRIATEAEAASATVQTTSAAEAEHLRTRLAEAEALTARERQLARDGERERERLETELHAAATRELRLREDLEETAERLAAGREEDLRAALARGVEAEEARAAAVADAETARAALATAEATIEALEEEAERAHAAGGALEESERSVHEQTLRELAEARAHAEAGRTRIDELEAALAAAEGRGRRHESGIREREGQLAARAADIESIAAERDHLREAGATVKVERDQLAAELETARARQRKLEEQLAHETAERERTSDLLRASQAALTALESVREEPATTPERSADPPPRPREVRVVTMASAAARRAREGDAGRRIVVVDVDETWEETAIDGHEVIVVSPEGDAPERVAELDPVRVVVNLLAPGALYALARLRTAGTRNRFWGCLVAPESTKALPLGMVETTQRPLDCDEVLTTLDGYAKRGTRVITAGADVDALMSLRQAMARLRMSVSMAWDAKQATDLLGVVRPEVVVVDLDLPRRDGYTIVSRLGLTSPIPAAVIVPGRDDASVGFATVLAQLETAERTIPRGRLLADVLAQSELPPAELAEKVRAMSRK